MNNDVLAVTMNRRSLLAGIALGGALAPAMVFAEGGLKGGSAPDDDTAIDDEVAEIGVTGADSYESPQFGYELGWGRDWEIYATNPGESSTADELDTLNLEWADAGTEEIAYISFMGFTLPVANINRLLEGLADPETIAELYGGDYEVDVVLVERDDGRQEVACHLVNIDDPGAQRWLMNSVQVIEAGVVLHTTLSLADGDLLGDVCEAFIEGVTCDGDPLMQLLAVDAVQEGFAGGA